MPTRSGTGVTVAVLAILLIVGCTDDDPTTAAALSPPTTASSVATPPATAAPDAPSSTAPTPITSPLRRSLTPLALDPVRFSSSVEQLDRVVSDRIIGSSWREGCPLPVESLRYLEVTHHTYDGGTAIGELVVDAAVADDVVAIFAQLYESEFPIESMRLVDDFGADDLRSMRANNTSAFNCRFVAATSNWSWHAYGRAIDINPLVNPYVTASGVEPPEGAAYVDRSRRSIGMIHADDAVTDAFAAREWEWGGMWRSGQDYQHFARASG